MYSTVQKINLVGLDFHVSAKFLGAEDAELMLNVTELDSFRAVLRIGFSGNHPLKLQNLTLECSASTAEVHGIYFGGDPHLEMGYLPHGKLDKQVAAHRGVPLISLIDRVGNNRCSMGFLGQQLETQMTAQLSEMDVSYHIRIVRPIATNSAGAETYFELPAGHFEEFIVDRSVRSWIDVVRDYGMLAKQFSKIDPWPAPAHSFDPVFCTWTAIHHDVSESWCRDTARLAADIGFRTWITDDGWHHDGGEFGNYDDVGEWQPSIRKFPDFANHVKEIQELGFRYLLWVAPFMLGTANKEIDRTGLVLQPGHPGANFEMLDPMQPEVSNHVRQMLDRLQLRYNLDGFKLDFIDAVSAQKVMPGGRSVGFAISAAIEQALSDIRSRRPDLLIEFRNSYANLAMQNFANLYRSSDLPVNFFLNRWQATMLRILNPGRAVVTDPMLWPKDDSIENVAVHLINGISAVPMVSIDLTTYPKQHLEVLRHWIGYYSSRKETLAFGEFAPHLRGTKLPLTYFRDQYREIIALYDEVPVRIGHQRRVDLLNASPSESILLASATVQNYLARVFGPTGDLVLEKELEFGARDIEIPIGGRVELT